MVFLRHRLLIPPGEAAVTTAVCEVKSVRRNLGRMTNNLVVRFAEFKSVSIEFVNLRKRREGLIKETEEPGCKLTFAKIT